MSQGITNFFKRLSFRRFSGKSAAIFFLNRKLAKAAGGGNPFGKIIDLSLDRQSKTLRFDLEGEAGPTTVIVDGYELRRRGKGMTLAWSRLQIEGPAREALARLFGKVEQIDIPPQYLTLLEIAL